MASDERAKTVFINCPFDREFKPLLEAMLFCVLDLGFAPRIATERLDSAENRLAKIVELIEAADLSIHDLSRVRAKKKGEFYRLNMPFELGIDYAARLYLANRNKKILVLGDQPYLHMPALSDLSGCDVAVHRGQFDILIREVRNWLVSEAAAPGIAPSVIIGRYTAFQADDLEAKQGEGFSVEDVQNRPTVELLDSMRRWIGLNPR